MSASEKLKLFDIQDGSTCSLAKDGVGLPCWVKVLGAILAMTIAILATALLWMFLHVLNPKVCLTEECVKMSAYIQNKMNKSVDPCTDFYAYSCGGWEDSLVITTDHSKFDVFLEVTDKSRVIFKKLLDDPSTVLAGKPSSSVAKLKMYYRTCMDISKIEADGTGPIQQVIEDLGSWSISPSYGGLARDWNLTGALIKHQKIGLAPFFGFSVGIDYKNSSRKIMSFSQGGLALSSYEEYTSPDADKFRQAFLQYAVEVGKLLGGDNSTQGKMEAIYDFEQQLAKFFVSKEETQNITNLYNLMTIADLQKSLGNQIDLKFFMSSATNRTLTDSYVINVHQPKYFHKLGPLLANTSEQVLQDYMVWHMVQRIPGYLPQSFVDAALPLDKVELGISSLTPRWERCISKTQGAFGYTLSSLYVHQAFPPENKAKVLKFVTDIANEFINNLDSLQWMDDSTRSKAKNKASVMEKKIGYPDWILDPQKLDAYYQEAEVKEGELLKNLFAVSRFEVNTMWKQFDDPPNPDEWHYYPSEVNGFFSITHNQLTLLAALLQPPIFDSRYPTSMAYGALGSISGHELTHGFDDRGSAFDEEGNMKNWWSEQSAQAFMQRTQCMVDQYSAFTYLGKHLNGRFTLGENIADNGGLKIGYMAFNKARAAGPPEEQLPGLPLTPKQLYFVGFAQVWCSYYTPEYASQAILSDQHSISKFRVLGSVSNMPEFAQAFSCPADSPLNPRHRCSVW